MNYLLHHLLRDSAQRFPEKEALIHGSRRLSYAEAHAQATRIGASLHKLDLGRSERVGIFLEPSIELALSIFATSTAGGAFVPIYHGLFPEQVAHIITDCGMRGLITDKSRFSTLRSILPHCPSLKFVLLTDSAPGFDDGRPIFSWQEWENTPADLAKQEQCVETDLAAILYTSGSTGKPKGVMLSHANLLAGSGIVSEYLEITSTDRILAALPFSFDAGLNQLITAIHQGGTLVLLKFLFAREIVEALRRERVTGLAGVPPLWSLLAQPSSTLTHQPLPDLRYVTNTGGALPLCVLQKLRDALPATRVYLMYGLTEAFRSTYLPPGELDGRPTSMGRAIPNTELLVIDENGRLCGPNEVGELVHHGPTVSMGYWGQPDLTKQVLRPHPCPLPGLPPSTRVCYSGDLVKRDSEGFLYFVGRRDNLIKCSGFRVSPTEVEEVLCASGMVHHAAAVGVPDEALGEHIEAFVVPGEGVECDIAGLLAFCGSRMPRHMIPRAIRVVSQLPRTSSGKIDYVALRNSALQASGSNPAEPNR